MSSTYIQVTFFSNKKKADFSPKNFNLVINIRISIVSRRNSVSIESAPHFTITTKRQRIQELSSRVFFNEEIDNRGYGTLQYTRE